MRIRAVLSFVALLLLTTNGTLGIAPDTTEPLTAPDDTQQTDGSCTAKKGRCQDVTVFCCGVYKKGLCSGDTYRLCCIPCWMESAVDLMCSGKRPTKSLFDR
ncbi:hypothetical protein LSAT2_026447 [Lamellibrachia satsuma]|nr:hypothetical protein LSAT2_026447 [Lamellibrachia satsuma]